MHTTDSVLAQFKRALELAKRLPSDGPKGPTSPWPNIIRLGHEGYVDNLPKPFALTAAELAEYETTVSWMSFIREEPYRRMLWVFAAGMPCWKIAKKCNPVVSQSTVNRRLLWALGFITFKLNNNESPPGFEVQKSIANSVQDTALASPWDVLRK